MSTESASGTVQPRISPAHRRRLGSGERMCCNV